MQNFSLKRQACQVFFIFLVKTSGPEASLLTLVCREKRELFIHEVFNLLPHCGTWANSPAYSFCAELWFACVTDSLSFFFLMLYKCSSSLLHRWLASQRLGWWPPEEAMFEKELSTWKDLDWAWHCVSEVELELSDPCGPLRAVQPPFLQWGEQRRG